MYFDIVYSLAEGGVLGTFMDICVHGSSLGFKISFILLFLALLVQIFTSKNTIFRINFKIMVKLFKAMQICSKSLFWRCIKLAKEKKYFDISYSFADRRVIAKHWNLKV